MDKLWAPWRSRYVTGAAKDPNPECIFCQKLHDDPKRDAPNYLLTRTENCFVILNLFPYNNGHLLVAPKRHVGDIEELAAEEMLELFEVTRWMVEVLRRAFQPDGFNIGINVGRVAGAGIPGHFHIHIVPRWNGDTNFMPVLGDVKVISEALDDSYRKLRAGLEETRAREEDQ
ncbi:HIT family protein [Candidatus Desulforudis audaxviator]|uniref:Histidine triad (HIT) protein n=1 Tax=Desulforudis audaxviator (strain MP104C) TaxID=477974 RepID=B1I5V6_DESAP|nr:HIT domain-containing protein [Candidatus Desulforudis audaxviator]ACA60364.1 histidine triad (HIT) protein [Candidatus Desulforudis audaxviator MP104C]AZK60419.1 histidine triad (HIT) protein [Candidatus Desulforudis audaxviator]